MVSWNLNIFLKKIDLNQTYRWNEIVAVFYYIFFPDRYEFLAYALYRGYENSTGEVAGVSFSNIPKIFPISLEIILYVKCLIELSTIMIILSSMHVEMPYKI